MEAVGYLKTKDEMFYPYDYYVSKNVLVNKWKVQGRGGEGMGG